MTFAALCELVQARGWCICVTAVTSGANIQPGDPQASLRSLLIFESRSLRVVGQSPLLAVRLDEPGITLDEAADALAHALTVAGAM